LTFHYDGVGRTRRPRSYFCKLLDTSLLTLATETQSLRIASQSVPSISTTCARVNPPLVEVRVPHDWFVVIIKHGTQATPELRVDKLSAPFPPEILVIQSVRLIESQEIVCKVSGSAEVFYVYVGMWRSRSFVISTSASHHNWNDVVAVQNKTLYITHFVGRSG